MNLPEKYLEKAKLMLKDGFEDYIKSFSQPPLKGMRINTLKCDINTLKSNFNFLQNPSKFCENLYVLPTDTPKLGNHPFHHAGAFYLTEPSASAAVTALKVSPNDMVLDLCAAPGGKTVQIAANLSDNGLLVSNEYVTSRTSALVSNVERCGIKNCIVTSSHPDLLCERFENFFDKILVDAPCSGEGMMRKEAAAIENWSQENVNECHIRQLKILNSADKALKCGGYLLYSTCTFSYEENEQTIAKFLEEHTNYVLCEIPKFGQDGYKEFAPNTENIEFTQHIFPSHGGEGHFVALLKKIDGEDKATINTFETDDKNKQIKIFKEFFAQIFTDELKGEIISVGDRIYITPKIFDLKGINVIRSGVFAGQFQKNRFVPSHALFAASYNAKQYINFKPDDILLEKFLHGEEIPCDEAFSGFVAVKVCNIPLSFGKASGGRLKNHYPKGLRKLN